MRTTKATKTAKGAKAPYIPHIRRTSEYGVYLIESESQAGTFYRTDALTEACSCTAGHYGKRCKHVRLAIGAWEMYRRLRQAAHHAEPAEPAEPAKTARIAA